MKKSSAGFDLLKLQLFALVSIFVIFANASAQQVEHYNSPLYSPKAYDPNQGVTSNGLPPALQEVGIDQKLGGQLPLDAEFKDENGKSVKLGEFFGKRPVILALVYYECPMLCNEVLNGLTGSLKGINFDAGKEFDVVAVSFDARENDKPDLAKNKKENYVARYGRAGAENGWHFLTGTQSEIDKLTNAVGYKYKFDEKTNQFAHAGGIMLINPDGKISHYFYGIDYAPKDLKLGLMESADDKIGSPAEQLLLYCYHYNPATGKYGFAILNVIRGVAVLTLLCLGGMIFYFRRYNR